MEIFLLVILIVLVLWTRNKVGDTSHAFDQKLEVLRREIQLLRTDLKNYQPSGKPETPTPEVKPEEKVRPQYRWEREEQPFTVKPPIQPQPEEKVVPPIEPVKEPEPIIQEEAPIFIEGAPVLAEEPAVERAFANVARPVMPPRVPREPELSFWDSFLKNNPDMEKFIGENLINKIGIAILVLGIGYFVKFAIDQDWINEIGRVAIGILAGGLLIGVAHRLRNSFSAFSSVLVGGGLAVLYFTIAIAFHEYHIFSQTVAFLLMVVITAFSIVLSLTYNRVELAVLSLIGGFATPFMLSTGEGNYKVLFIYVLILNVGMLTLSYFKKWNILHVIAYGFTVILYGGWLSSRVIGEPNAPYIGALVFGTLFYLVFFVMNILYNVKEQAKFTALEITLLMSNTAFYYAAGMVILANINAGAYQGLFTVAVAALNCAFALVLYKRTSVDRNLLYLLIGLVITFISLAIPIQLHGNYITMFWALEAVLLLWFAQKSGLTLVTKGSVIVLGLMLISLVMDWGDIYHNNAASNPIPVLLNKGFVTSFIVVLSLLATLRLLANQQEPINFWLGKLEVGLYYHLLGYLTLGAIYMGFALELNYQLITYVGFSPSRTIILACYNLFFIAGLLVFTQQRKNAMLAIAASLLGVLGVAGYIVFTNTSTMALLREHFLSGEPTFIGFPFHYLALLLTLSILFLIARTRKLFELPITLLQGWPWFLGIAVVWMASAELFFHLILFNFSFTDAVAALKSTRLQAVLNDRFEYVITQTTKVGLPILWGICAFIFMWLGLNRKNKALRIFSLSLFALTLAKLFIYDIRGISEGGKIAAFISLGVILLVISFMYQKIRKIILADDTAKAEA